MSALKETLQYYKKLKYDEKQRKRLLSQKMDYDFLQYIIDTADAKDVIIDITLADHTRLVVKRDKSKRLSPMFTGDDYTID